MVSDQVDVNHLAILTEQQTLKNKGSDRSMGSETLEIMTDRPTNRRTDLVTGKFHSQLTQQ